MDKHDVVLPIYADDERVRCQGDRRCVKSAPGGRFGIVAS